MFWNKYKIDWHKDNQLTRVEKILKYYKGGYVNAWKLSYDAKVLHYTEMIRQLRNKGYIIENKIKYKGKVKYSSYKLID